MVLHSSYSKKRDILSNQDAKLSLSKMGSKNTLDREVVALDDMIDVFQKRLEKRANNLR